MSGIELNKIAASILLAALIAMLAGKIADLLYRPVLEPQQRGYQIELSDEVRMADNTKVDPFTNLNIEQFMAKANSKQGKVVFKKCLTCHTMNKGGHNKVGPNLWNIVNAKKANSLSYAYSKPLSNKGGEWDYTSLFHFIYQPKKYIPGTKMSFIGIKNFEDIANVIKYLESSTD